MVYDTKARFASYWHQIDETIYSFPKNVLEIGIGNGFVSNYFKNHCDFKTTTTDIEGNPDYTASVKNLPFKDNEFDTVLCFQVLEHLPIEDLKQSLKELARVSSDTVLISLPDQKKKIKISLPFFKEKTIRLPINRNEMDKGHYWEITNLQTTRTHLEAYLTITKEYAIYENNNRMYICKVKK